MHKRLLFVFVHTIHVTSIHINLPTLTLQFQGDSVVVSGSSTGQIKVWDVRQTSLFPVTFARDPNMTFAKRDRVRCLATTDANIYWGDNNIKVLDLKAGNVIPTRPFSLLLTFETFVLNFRQSS